MKKLIKNNKIFILVFIASGLFTPQALSKVNYADNSGFSITNVSESAASVEVVYDNFINHIDSWWPKDHTWWKGTLKIDEYAGGCFCETTQTSSAAHMQISFIHPQKKVVMTGGLGPLQEMGIYGALTWQFTSLNEEDSNTDSSNKGTRVTLTYHASGTIQFNGKKATNEDAVKLVQVVDKVQAQQLSSLTSFSNEK
jgi:hypothetical protein